MKLNEYFLLSDIKKLSSDEFNSLVEYLKLFGIEIEHSLKSLKRNHRRIGSVWCVFDGYNGDALYMTVSSLLDPDLTVRHDLADIKRMISLSM